MIKTSIVLGKNVTCEITLSTSVDGSSSSSDVSFTIDAKDFLNYKK